MPDAGPLGDTFFEARCLATVAASWLKSPSSGYVDSVLTFATPFLHRHMHSSCMARLGCERLRTRLPPCAKEVGQQCAAFLGQQPGLDGDLMVQLRMVHDAEYRAASPPPWDRKPRTPAADARMQDRPGAHRAGLERRVQACTLPGDSCPAPLRRPAWRRSLQWAVGSLSRSTRLLPRPTMAPSRTTTAPTGTSPSRSAAAASSMAIRRKLKSSAIALYHLPQLVEV